MVKVTEYINKKRYMRVTKIGRWWRVPKLKEKGKKVAEVKGERKGEERGRPRTIWALHEEEEAI